jgi:hypothetical protein
LRVIFPFGFASLVWHSRPRFFTEFGVSGFSAVGDLGQELTDSFDIFIGPRVNNGVASLDDPGNRYLTGFHIANQRSSGYPQDLCFFIRGVAIHSVVAMTDRFSNVNAFCSRIFLVQAGSALRFAACGPAAQVKDFSLAY